MLLLLNFVCKCLPGDRVTMLANDVNVHAQQSAPDDVIASTDQSHAVNAGQCDVTFSRSNYL